MRFLLAIMCPPLAVLLCGKPVQFLLNVLLTFCFYVPGMIHALSIVGDHKAETRTKKVVKAIKKSQRQSVAA